MRAFLILCATSFALVLPAAAQAAKDNPKCSPNPVFEKFPGSYYQNCERSRFAELELEVAKDPAKPDGPYDKVKKEGETWYYFDPIPKDASGALPSPLELQRNFENAVRAANGTVLGKQSGSAKALVYRLEKGGAEYWGTASCGSSGGNQCSAAMHKIVRVKAMEQSIVLSADQIGKDLGTGGKVVFYGIYFDTDKATIKAESAPTLAEMAKWLKANAGAKVYIVGHTDMQGAHDHNVKLSRDRAASVVAALAGPHGIAKDRLLADGAGPLAPVASNADEAGRAKNRRVEMVLR
jgi:outer membrane protein OmpA-like peptidoglycan-associated protein